MKERKPGSLMQKLLCVSLVVMWGQGTEATASPQPLKDATFKMLPALDVMFTEDVLWETPARSRMECSVMCRGDAQCLMFTFRPATDGPAGSCRSYLNQHTAQGMNELVHGARSYKLVRELIVEVKCRNTSDCVDPATACYSDLCLCDGGLFYDHTENACVSSCKRRLSDTFLKYLHMDLTGHDMEASFYGKLQDCLLWCSANIKCLVMVRRAGLCYFKSATAQDFPDDFDYLNGSALYQRTCL